MALALGCCLPSVAWAQPAAEADVYVVQPGDTCGTIGRKVFGDAASGSAKLHALNKMGPPPHVLKPGSVLRIKGDPDAHLTFIKPQVNAKRSGNVDWRQALTGEGLWRLDSVNTLRQAGAEVTFRDLTRLQMNENALVVIYGEEPKATDTVKKSGAVELLQGELSVSLAELRGEPVGVKTPAGAVSARSKDAVIGVDAQQMSRVSVFDGQAEVSAQGQRVAVPRNHGTRVEKGKVPEPPRPLPPAPEWQGGVRSVRLLLDDKGVDETLAWAPVKEAATYRVELARDERFNDRVYAESVDAGAQPLQAVAPALQPGTYFGRVRAVDAAGLLGLASAVRQVEVLRVKTEHGTLGTQGIQGSSRVEFAVEGAEAFDFRLDGAPTTHPVRVDSVGAHTLELRPRGMPDARPETLTLTVKAPQIIFKQPEYPPDGTLEMGVKAVDDQGQPVPDAEEKLTLRAISGSLVEGSLRRQQEGVLVARVRPNPETYRIRVEVLWGGTPVNNLSTQLLPRPPPGIAPEVALVDLVGVPTGGVVEAASLPTAFLPQAWLLELREQSGTSGGALTGGRTSLTVDGRLSDRVAVGAGLALRPGTLLGGDAAGGVPSTALAASVSGRVSVSDFPSLRVLLSFDGTYANSHFDEEASGLRLRPAVIVGGRWGRWAFSTSQGYALRPGEARAAWDSTYQAWFHVLPLLAVGAEVAALVDATPETPGPSAFAAGVGARWKLGGFEVGASARRGFGPDTARVWGGWSGQLVLGWSGLRALATQ